MTSRDETGFRDGAGRKHRGAGSMRSQRGSRGGQAVFTHAGALGQCSQYSQAGPHPGSSRGLCVLIL